MVRNFDRAHSNGTWHKSFYLKDETARIRVVAFDYEASSTAETIIRLGHRYTISGPDGAEVHETKEKDGVEIHVNFPEAILAASENDSLDASPSRTIPRRGVAPSSTTGIEELMKKLQVQRESASQSEPKTFRPYDAFICHAGPDKETLAVPLYNALRNANVPTFVDKESINHGDNLSQRIVDAANEARIGLFILSPELFARKWTMREFEIFLERRKNADTCDVWPVLIPVFYRWSPDDCSRKDFFNLPNVGKVFMRDGFFNPDRQKEFSTEHVFGVMREIKNLKGVNVDPKARRLVENGRYGATVSHIRDVVLETLRRNAAVGSASRS